MRIVLSDEDLSIKECILFNGDQDGNCFPTCNPDCMPECAPNCNPNCDPNCDPTCAPTCSPSCNPCYPSDHCNPEIFYCNPESSD